MYKNIAALLEKKGVTAYRMCKDIGISPVVISDLKSGKSKPKLDKLMKIADYLGCTVEELTVRG